MYRLTSLRTAPHVAARPTRRRIGHRSTRIPRLRSQFDAAPAAWQLARTKNHNQTKRKGTEDGWLHGRQGRRRHRRGARHRPRHGDAGRQGRAPASSSTTSAPRSTARARRASSRPTRWSSEIRKAGGKAVANFESVAEPKSAENIVQCALDNFRRIDGVINNAGILRDRIFHRMSVVDFDQVIKVHLYGAFYVSRAAANHFKEQESRRLRALHVDLGPDRQLRPGQLRRGQARHRRPVAQHRARHAALQRALELHLAVRLEPHDRHHPDRDAGAEGARRAHQADDAGQDRAARDLPAVRPRQGASRARSSAAACTSCSCSTRRGRCARCSASEGWTPQTIAEHALPAMRSSFTPLDRSGDVFSWDPV